MTETIVFTVTRLRGIAHRASWGLSAFFDEVPEQGRRLNRQDENGSSRDLADGLDVRFVCQSFTWTDPEELTTGLETAGLRVPTSSYSLALILPIMLILIFVSGLFRASAS